MDSHFIPYDAQQQVQMLNERVVAPAEKEKSKVERGKEEAHIYQIMVYSLHKNIDVTAKFK